MASEGLTSFPLGGHPIGFIMRYWTTFILVFILTACSTSHNIKMPMQPCLLPWKGYNFSLCQDFIVDIDDHTYDIPKGFTTDLASVPRILWSIYAPNRTETIAGAVIHDYFYFCPGGLTRKEADAIFYDALIAQGIPTKTAFKYWIAVRLFGKSHFNKGALCTYKISVIDNTNGLQRPVGFA